MAYRCEDSDASLPQRRMDSGVGERGEGVANEGGEEDERYDCVCEAVVGFKLAC